MQYNNKRLDLPERPDFSKKGLKNGMERGGNNSEIKHLLEEFEERKMSQATHRCWDHLCFW